MCNKKKQLMPGENGRITRGMTNVNLHGNGTPSTCIGDAIKLWSSAPKALKCAKTIYAAK